MSLDPEFNSSGFGLTVLSIQTTVALAFWRRREPRLGLGQLRAAGPRRPPAHRPLLWAYLSFMQFVIIWSGDMPAGASWYLRRSGGGVDRGALGDRHPPRRSAAPADAAAGPAQRAHARRARGGDRSPERRSRSLGWSCQPARCAPEMDERLYGSRVRRPRRPVLYRRPLRLRRRVAARAPDRPIGEEPA